MQVIRRQAQWWISGALTVGILLAGSLGPAQAALPAAAAAGTLQLHGSGTLFNTLTFNTMAKSYLASNHLSLSYVPDGSVASIQDFIGNKVDFGGSLNPMDPIEGFVAAQNGGPFVQIPDSLGAFAITYNVPGLNGQSLRFDDPTLARIYLGQITNWNDPAIATLNPGITFPNLALTPVRSTDRWGLNATFSRFLSMGSPDWVKFQGLNKSVAWPVGVAVSPTVGIYKTIAANPGYMGPSSLNLILSVKLPFAALKNPSGDFVLPTLASVNAAAAQFPNVSITAPWIINAPGASSYPLATYSWALIRQHFTSSAKGAAVANLFRWLVTTGQNAGVPLHYMPMPVYPG